MTTLPLEVFCDESGYTGTRLLDPEQRVFSFAAVAVSDGEAWSIIDDARRRHGLVGDELKSTVLLKTEPGRKFVRDCLMAIDDRYRFVVFDKLLGACTKLFEYIYEPVFQNDPALLYSKNMHRFVGMYCYTFCVSGDPVAETVVREFEAFMRSLDPALAPSLFDPSQAFDDENPFEMIRRFAQGHRERIVSDNVDGLSEMADRGQWTLDLGIAGMWSLLTHFGAGGRPLAVTCDASRPIETAVAGLTDERIAAIANFAGSRTASRERLGWRLARPIGFGDSRNHPSLQLADIVAGAATSCLRGNVGTRGLVEIAQALDRNQHPHSIMPDSSVVQPDHKEAFVNWVILDGLGRRAHTHDDSSTLLHELYAAAERMWDEGAFVSATRD